MTWLYCYGALPGAILFLGVPHRRFDGSTRYIEMPQNVMKTETSRIRIVRYLIATVAVAFGLLTLWSGGAVLFGGEEARQAAGDYVPFVVWSNFVAGFFYMAAGIGLWRRWKWARWVAAAIVVGTVGTYLAFGLHILRGEPYEMRTVVAMAVRTGVWIGIAVFAIRCSTR